METADEECDTRAGTKAYCPPEFHTGSDYNSSFDI